MKYLLFVLGLSSLLHAADPFYKGSWKLNDAGCTHSSYVYSEEEKDFIEAIKTGKTFDLYEFVDAFGGTYESRFQFSPEAYCVGRTKFKINLPQEGEVVFNFEKTEWKLVSTKPNVTIKCSDDDSAPNLHYRYRWDKTKLILYWPQGAACGDYELRFLKQ